MDIKSQLFFELRQQIMKLESDRIEFCKSLSSEITEEQLKALEKIDSSIKGIEQHIEVIQGKWSNF